MNEIDVAVRVPGLIARLDRIIELLVVIAAEEADVMADLSALEAEVAQNTDVVGSAVTLLTTLASDLRNAAGDPAAVQALADQLDQNNAALAGAVAANTPAAPPA